MQIHILTPFSRPQNLDILVRHLRPLGVVWHPIHHESITWPAEPWIQPLRAIPPPRWDPCYWKLNAWIEQAGTGGRGAGVGGQGSVPAVFQPPIPVPRTPLRDDDWYGVLCDDDLYGSGVVPAVRAAAADVSAVIVSAKRGHYIVPTGHLHPTFRLVAAPRNMRVDHVSNGQMFLRGHALARMRYANAPNADGQAIALATSSYRTQYAPKAHAFLNVLQPGRWDRRVLAELVASGRLNVNPLDRLPSVAALTLVRDTPDLVEAMRKQISGIRIVDNGSQEPVNDSWLRLPENRYWSGGWNAALRELNAEGIEWAWLLNSDVSGVNAGQLDALVHYARQHGAAMISPAVRKCSWPMMRPGRGVHDTHYIDCVCPVVNVPWFIDHGGFDECLPGWGADLDLCFRTRPDTKLVAGHISVDHPYRTTSNRLNDDTMYRIGETRRYLEAKHGDVIREFLPGYWRYRAEE